MRKHELKEGIEVLDSDGTVIGTSQVAAKSVRQNRFLFERDFGERLKCYASSKLPRWPRFRLCVTL